MCSLFAKGNCSDKTCKFAHVKPRDGSPAAPARGGQVKDKPGNVQEKARNDSPKLNAKAGAKAQPKKATKPAAICLLASFPAAPIRRKIVGGKNAAEKRAMPSAMKGSRATRDYQAHVIKIIFNRNVERHTFPVYKHMVTLLRVPRRTVTNEEPLRP